MAQHVDSVMDNLKGYIEKKLGLLANNDPLMALIKPFASRAINNNLYQVENILKQIADKDGMLDVDGLLSETIESVLNTKPFKINSGVLGELEIGSGKVKMGIPLLNKDLVLNHQDLIELKEMLSN